MPGRTGLAGRRGGGRQLDVARFVAFPGSRCLLTAHCPAAAAQRGCAARPGAPDCPSTARPSGRPPAPSRVPGPRVRVRGSSRVPARSFGRRTSRNSEQSHSVRGPRDASGGRGPLRGHRRLITRHMRAAEFIPAATSSGAGDRCPRPGRSCLAASPSLLLSPPGPGGRCRGDATHVEGSLRFLAPPRAREWLWGTPLKEGAAFGGVW